MIKAEKLDTVTVNYKGTLTDGTLFDESPEEKPLKFIIGKYEVIPGFDEAVEGMFKGETKTFTIPCEKAYGEKKPELIETLKLSDLPAGARGFLDRVAELVGKPVEVVSIGPDREQTILIVVTRLARDNAESPVSPCPTEQPPASMPPAPMIRPPKNCFTITSARGERQEKS